MSDLLPLNATPLEKAIVNALLVNESLQAGKKIAELMDAQNVEAKFLPWLAWHLNVEDWQYYKSDQAQRDAIVSSYFVHSKKGTVESVKRVLNSFGYPDAKVIENKQRQQEWLEAGGKYIDGSFEINGQNFSSSEPPASMSRVWAEYFVEFNIANAPSIANTQAELRKKIEKTAPARAHLIALLYRFFQEFNAKITTEPVKNNVRILFNNCRSMSIHKPEKLNGCWTISGNQESQALIGFFLNGNILLKGYEITGKTLDSAWGDFKKSIYQTISVSNNRKISRNWMLGDYFYSESLDGQRTLGDAILTGDIVLNGTNSIGDSIISREFTVLLNGSRKLGMASESKIISFSANAIIKSRNTIKEVAL